MQPLEAPKCDIPIVRNAIGASHLWMNPCGALSTGYLVAFDDKCYNVSFVHFPTSDYKRTA